MDGISKFVRLLRDIVVILSIIIVLVYLYKSPAVLKPANPSISVKEKKYQNMIDYINNMCVRYDKLEAAGSDIKKDSEFYNKFCLSNSP